MPKPGRDKPKGESEKRGPGRPTTDIPTMSFCYRSPITMVEAYEKLQAARGTNDRAAELRRAADEYLLRMYWQIKDEPDSPLLVTAGSEVKEFLAAVEAYYREAKKPIPPAPKK